LGGARLGLLLAYLWAAYPFTLMTLASSSSDALVAALVLATLLASARPVARGAAVALAGLTKLAPFFLLPLLAGYGRGLRGALITMVIAVVVTLAVLAPVDPGAFLDRTVLFQAHRASPFSIWGLWGGLAWMRGVVVVGSVALAVAVAVLPRRRDQATLCALAGAVVIAVQLGLEHWFYLYLPWFVPLVCAALLAPREDPAPAISSAAEGPLAQAHLMPAWVRARRRPKPRACSQDVRTAETDR